MRAALAGLTARGRALLAAGVTAFLLAAMLDQQDIMRVGLLASALPLLAALSVSRTRFRLASDRTIEPSRTPSGESATVTVRLENVAHLPTGLLMVEDAVPPALGPRPRFVVDRLAPKSIRSVTYTVHGDRRGRYPIGPLSVRLTDPFGFCQLDRSFSGQRHLLVTPRTEELPTVPLSGDWSGTGESRARSIAAAGEDDVAVREYRHGDELRRVHWRATAAPARSWCVVKNNHGKAAPHSSLTIGRPPMSVSRWPEVSSGPSAPAPRSGCTWLIADTRFDSWPTIAK